jgi:hypothetical protein
MEIRPAMPSGGKSTTIGSKPHEQHGCEIMAAASSTSRIIEEAAPGYIYTPFVILIDTAEKSPFAFDGIRARSFIDKDQNLYVPRTERRWLGIGAGDYSLAGFERFCGIERKSLVDLQGTLLGWPIDISEQAAVAEWDSRRQVHRRARFKRELARLARMQCKAVVVEATLGQCLEMAPCWGVRSEAANAKYIYSTALAWMEEFPVSWIFCDDRQMAAVTTFRLLEKFWARMQKKKKREAA